MVAMTASLVYALLVGRLPLPVSAIVIVAATAIALFSLRGKTLSAFRAAPAGWNAYWDAQRTLQHSLAPNETVWISPPRHPVAAFDASYYWYNFRESAPSAIRARAKYPQFLPPIDFAGLPPCTATRDDIRYLELGDWMPFLDNVCHCGETAFNAGLLTPTDSLGIFELGAEQPPSAKGSAWMQRTRGLWSDLCRRQEVFLRGGQLNITP
jgi:hypothetical protein